MITQTAKYALRTLGYLAQQEGETFLQTREIAEALNIPLNYLGKILQKVSRARLVDSQKGLHGGFKAIRPANQISLFEVLMAVDCIPRDVALTKSDLPDKHLPPTFFDRFESIARIYTDFLRKTTLADMLAVPDAEAAAETAAAALVAETAGAVSAHSR